MKILLDTHAFIWFSENDPTFPEETKKIIENPRNNVYISIASFWEMAIKISLKKLQLKKKLRTIIKNTIKNGIEILPINTEHILKVSSLSGMIC